MQKIKRLFIAFVLMASVFAFVGCDDSSGGGDLTKPSGLDEGITYGVSFDTGIENVKIPTQSVANGGFASAPTELYKEGYDFGGWWLDDYEWNFGSDRVYASIILKAKWEQSPEDWNMTEGVILRYDSAINGFVVVGYSGDESDVVISRFAKDNGVFGVIKKIGREAFQGNATINSITLPNTIDEIGAYAFSSSNLNSIFVEDGGELVLGEYAFSMLNLGSFVMPDSVVGVGDCCFMQSGLTDVKFGSVSKLKSIGMNGFYQNGITRMIVPKGVKNIGELAFWSNPLELLVLPSNIETVGDNIIGPSNDFDTVYFSGDTLPVKGNGFSRSAYPDYMEEYAYSSFDRGGRFWYYGANGMPEFYESIKTQEVDLEELGLNSGNWSAVKIIIQAKYQANSEIWGSDPIYIGAMSSKILSFDIDVYKYTGFEIYAYIDDDAYAKGEGGEIFKTEEIKIE